MTTIKQNTFKDDEIFVCTNCNIRMNTIIVGVDYYLFLCRVLP
jgi:hypothetical protein